MSTNRRDYIIKKKKKKRRRIVKWISFLFLFTILAGASYAYYLFEKTQNAVTNSYEEIRPNAPKRNLKDESFSILFIGVDDSRSRNYNDSGTRTDALILATFNPKDSSVKMVSIPRDSYVYIPSEGIYDKINHAHVYDGIKSTVETVEYLFNIQIDYYVKMNFYAFIDTVDALGGIEVEVPYDIVEKNSEDKNTIVLKEGLQHLNGEEALALARTRKKDSDIERGKRQQEIIKAIIKKAASMGSITKYDDVIEAIGENMKTNLIFNEMLSLVSYATTTSNLNIESYQLKGYDDYINSVYYYRLDDQSLQEVKEIFKHHLQGTVYTGNDSSQQAHVDNGYQ